MKFSYIGLLCSALILALPQTSLAASDSRINLAAGRGLVLSVENRQTVLEAGRDFLTPRSDEMLVRIDDLKSPFSFEAPTQTELVATEADEKEAIPEPIQFEDAEVLRLSAASFANRVRGAIVRGETSYLQLEGGTLLKSGTSFPVRLPEAPDQTFTLTIPKITPDGYTLQIGDATKQVRFSDRSQSIRFTRPQP